MLSSKIEEVKNLPCWSGAVEVAPLSGGMTNFNFRVADGNNDYVVRLGVDVPEHLIWREHEGITSQVAATSGFSPRVVYRDTGVLVIDFIVGRVYGAEDVRSAHNLLRLIELLRSFHLEMPQHFNGYPIMFWVFQVLRHYKNMLEQGNSPYLSKLAELMDIARQLEHDVGAVDIVFAHNDLLAANFIDDGEKIWLIDFDYAGFNSPLFDLANLASNSELDHDQERVLLEEYFLKDISETIWRSYHGMKCASLLRETMWSMVSEIYSQIDFDYPGYTQQNFQRFDRIYLEYKRAFI